MLKVALSGVGQAAVCSALRFIPWFVLSIAAAVPIVSASAADYCKKGGGAVAADLSGPVDDKFLKKMREIGVTTIIRYYDYEPPTLPKKTLHKKERDKIVGAGFSVAVVFQHHNNNFSSFTPQRGRNDAIRSLVLAKENLQTKGSVIYFGVDGGWGTAEQLKSIESYFKAANAELKPSGYRVGVFGGGLVCKTLLEKKLAEVCWLANAKSWPGYADSFKSRRWKLVQSLPSKCGGKEVDFNVTNGTDTDFGQFGL